MKVAKLYNDYTGANVSHFELRQLGVMEFEQIMSSLTAWGVIDNIASYRESRDKEHDKQH